MSGTLYVLQVYREAAALRQSPSSEKYKVGVGCNGQYRLWQRTSRNMSMLYSRHHSGVWKMYPLRCSRTLEYIFMWVSGLSMPGSRMLIKDIYFCVPVENFIIPFILAHGCLHECFKRAKDDSNFCLILVTPSTKSSAKQWLMLYTKDNS